jgi:hypothetical protein
MGKTVGAFGFEIDIHGARLVSKREPLCAGCRSDGEIDNNIRLLKNDLDAVAAQMKAAIRKQDRDPIF